MRERQRGIRAEECLQIWLGPLTKNPVLEWAWFGVTGIQFANDFPQKRGHLFVYTF